MDNIRVRFAPSPTGKIHIGNIRTALFNWLWARKNNGTFILRIEDTDKERSSRDYENIIFREINWLGLDIDESIKNGGEFGPYRQSERLNIYKKYVQKLIDEDKAYYCYCTSEELEDMRQKALDRGKMPKYNGKCRNLSEKERRYFEAEGRKAVVRFKVPEKSMDIIVHDTIRGKVKFNTSVLDDFVIYKSDGMPTYNFAVVIDDALMKITDVIRGEDHLSNTPKQLLIYEALGIKPPRFAHLSLILDENRAKLKKRSNDDAVYVSEYRDKGYLPEALFNFLSLLGWSPKDEREFFSKDDLIKEFDLEMVNKSAAIFDIEKLNWMNGKYIREFNLDKILDLSLPYLIDAGYINEKISSDAYKWLKKVIDVARTGVNYLSQIPEESSLFFTEFKYEDQEGAVIEFRENKIELVFDTLINKLEKLKEFNPDSINNIFKEMKNELPVKARAIYHPVRLALTGKKSGPEMKDIIYILGLDEVEKRLNNALELVNQ